MLDGYRIVTITPIGRRKYIENLYPKLLAHKGLIDQHIFWINTDITYDVGYVYSILSKDIDFFTVMGSIGTKKNTCINDIYLNNNDKKTIYIKISDDICWFEDKAIYNLIKCCIDNPEHPFVYPLTINTGKTTMFHQVIGAVSSEITQISPLDFRKDGFNLSTLKPKVSADIHHDFLLAISNGDIAKYCGFFDKFIIYDYEHIPEHCVAWMGNPENIKYRDEKSSLTDAIPKQKESQSCICGNSIVSHFAYNTHEDYLLAETDILEQYREIL